MLLLLLLLLVGKIAGWLTVITGFAGVVVSALSLQDKLISKASQFLGIATGILAAAEGVTLQGDTKTGGPRVVSFELFPDDVVPRSRKEIVFPFDHYFDVML
jgi:hypothetical protein